MDAEKERAHRPQRGWQAAVAMVADRVAPSAPPIRILLVDSSEADYWRTRDLLDAIDHARFTFDWARDFETGMTRLAEGGFDVCLVDHGLPDRAGLELVHAAQNCRLQVPSSC